ncbi:MAG: class I SAM-dependent methyltransferase [Clostridiales Family XIII bacterium]|jgi:SAM-dependent methyltransferase|nr:class I SAM-dependent methyltransferase [Clostridiales Family XIII bacterium]
MLFEWNDEKIALYVRASGYTGFHRKLAEYIVPLLKADDEVLDIGCGPGLIALSLAPVVKSITAIDIDDKVLRFLARQAEKTKVKNITAITADIADVQNLDCDLAFICYFGCSEDSLSRIIAAAKRYTVIITHGEGVSEKPSKISTTVRRAYAPEIESFLRAHDYEYKRIDERLDFSQPLKSREEAYDFFDTYCIEDVKAAREEKIDMQMRQLVPTGNETYPLVFPCGKDASIFVIQRSIP